MASIPSFRFDITGATGSTGFLTPKSGWRAYIMPRGANASQDSTGTLITFDSAAIASRFAVNNWIQVGLSTDNQRRVSAVGGNSIAVAGSAITVSENNRVFLIGNTQPTVSGGSATYTIPNTLIRQRGDDAADLFTNSMITSNSDGLIQGYAAPAMYDVIVQDGNQANQGFIADMEVGTVEGVSVTDNAIFGASVTINNLIVARVGVASGASSGGAVRVVDGSRFTTIQAAIDDLPAAGGVVDARGFSGSLASGITISTPCTLLLGAATITGSINPLINITTSNCSIVGLGYNITTIRNTTDSANVIRIAAGVANTTINDCLIDAGGKTLDEANRTQGNCVYAAGTAGSTVTNIRLTGCRLIDGHNGFLGEYTQRSVIEGNLFDFSHAALAQCSLRAGSFNVIRGNIFLAAGLPANAIYVLNVAPDESVGNAITGNVITGAYNSEAINLFGVRNTIGSNTINITGASTGTSGIALVQPTGGDGASHTRHNAVIGNVINLTGASTATGILIQDNGSTGNVGSNDNLVSGNMIRGTLTGVAIGNSCTRNMVVGNRIDITGGTGMDGIAASGTGAVDNVIVGNMINSATRHGIIVSGPARNVVSSNMVFLSNNDGIRLENAGGSVAIGNLTRGNTATGFGIVTGGTSITHFGNHSVGDGTAYDALIQTISAATDSITLRSSFIKLDASSSFTLTSAPTLADGFDSQTVKILNISGSTITIQDQGTLASSNLRLGTTTRALGPRDTIELLYSSNIGDWVEQRFSDVI